MFFELNNCLFFLQKSAIKNKGLIFSYFLKATAQLIPTTIFLTMFFFPNNSFNHSSAIKDNLVFTNAL